ncbi:MAG: YceI family protein [Bacteroidia bacterium]
MKKFLFAIALVGASFAANAQAMKGKVTDVSFYSHTALEDIKAESKTSTIILVPATNTFIAEIKIKSFDFPNELMEEHFNENYMESEKFPTAKFTGKIQEKIDYTKDGTYNITMVGKLLCHGVEKDRTVTGTLTVKGGEVTVDCKFDIKLQDHSIKVPEAVGAKIAENIEVTVHTVLVKPEAKK